MRTTCDCLIFDLGDVLFTWSAETKTTIPPKILRKILNSATWFAYEKGELEEGQVYRAVSEQFGFASEEVSAALQGARDSLQRSSQLVTFIKEIKAARSLKVYAMSNISAPDWVYLRDKAFPEDWALFDRVFTSAEAHERKPNLGFYQQVLEATGADPSRTVFVDDKLENVLSARSLGLNAIVFDSPENVIRTVTNYVSDPLQRASAWLKENAKRMVSVTDTGVSISENFAQLLILEVTGDRSLVDYVEFPRLFNFFSGDAAFTTSSFPNDLDTTSIGLTLTEHVDYGTKMAIMDEMLEYRNADGIVTVYFDEGRPRIDPIVCTNVLTFFYKHGRGEELEETLTWVLAVLDHRAYLEGTYYYIGGDAFLFFVSRLMGVAPSVKERITFLFRERVRERFGKEGDALSLAMRILAASSVGIRDVVDRDVLLVTQELDGGFPIGWMYRFVNAGIRIGNRGLATALAVKAIEVVDEMS
ncbi:HAD-like protein [Schizopora paradoxa]|uniref:HAD-like protein n=1 Tax=Schizopora paradoxa TaxID=27342 RepID=A0A0H2R4B5_9AGAM|nr:HAD-like protein [Schizopora paradoxa]